MNTEHTPPAAPKTGVVNCISGPSELATWIRDEFASTLGTLADAPGIREFYLRRAVAVSGELSHCLYLSITVWETRRDFDRWQASPGFVAAHPDRNRYGAEFARMRSVRLAPDLTVWPDTTIADLDAAILVRLGGEHPGLIPVGFGCGFVSQLHWETAQFPGLEYRQANRHVFVPGTGAAR